MGWLDDLFGGGQEQAGKDIASGAQRGIAARKAMLAKALGLLEPFRTQGLGALGEYQAGLEQESDPVAFINKILNQYQESPAATFQTKQGIEAAQNALQAAGLTGSGAEQKELTKYAQGVASGDQQRFLENVLGVNTQRLSGLQGIGQMGFQAASQGANLSGQAGAGIQQGFEDVGAGQAASDIGRARGISGIGGLISGGLLGFLQSGGLDALFSKNNSGGNGGTQGAALSPEALAILLGGA